MPDGYVLRTTLHGDENKHWCETADGYHILETDSGYFYYLQKNDSSVSTMLAHNVEDRSRKEKRFLRRKGLRSQ